ncbi:MAG: VWA-like domain-containing protein [Halobacteriota archaeon]|nr:VWA-like domain-containing protein [Halobacteriota archaeon]
MGRKKQPRHDEVMDRVKESLVSMVMSKPFYAIIAMKMVIIEDESIETMCVDGKSMWFNPNFVLQLKDRELAGSIAHEVLHVALTHHLRIRKRNLEKWRIACDYVVNDIIINDGMKLPEGVLYQPKFHGMSAEEVYEILPDKQDGNSGQEQKESKDQGASGGQGSGNKYNDIGDFKEPQSSDGQSMDAQALNEAIQDARMSFYEAAKQAQEMGKMPAGMKRFVSEILDPEVLWTDVLRLYIELAAKNDYNWLRPNRRYTHMGVYIPTLFNKELSDVIVVVDTSGSINQKTLDMFQGEVNGIAESYKPRIHVLYCDAAISGTEVFEPGDYPIHLSPSGGGGTRFTPAFEYAENIPEASLLIYLTDGYGEFPRNTPDIRTIWVSTRKSDYPFGDVIKV